MGFAHSIRNVVSASAAVLSLALVACSSAPSDSSADMADAAASSGPVISTAHTWPTGGRCTEVTETYATCEDLSTCPGVTIDTDVLPNCGYSVHGDVIDPECLCFGTMCPMGAPETCADMAAILASGITTQTICDQAQAGHCVSLGTTGGINTCQLCRWNCAGVSNCLQACNC